MKEEIIPHEFFIDSWEQCHSPKACVDLKNKFIKVNSAWEEMLGYSSQELKELTWIDITKQSDVGSDLANVHALVRGEIDSYRMEKTYVRKDGQFIDVILYVTRFPKKTDQALLLFNVAVEIDTNITDQETFNEYKRKQAELLEEMNDKIEEKIKEVKDKTLKIQVGDNFNNGGNKTTTSNTTYGSTDTKIWLFVVAPVTLAIVSLIAYAIYAFAPGNQNIPINPPTEVVKPFRANE